VTVTAADFEGAAKQVQTAKLESAGGSNWCE
jgi:hypothetical protein